MLSIIVDLLWYGRYCVWVNNLSALDIFHHLFYAAMLPSSTKQYSRSVRARTCWWTVFYIFSSTQAIYFIPTNVLSLGHLKDYDHESLLQKSKGKLYLQCGFARTKASLGDWWSNILCWRIVSLEEGSSRNKSQPCLLLQGGMIEKWEMPQFRTRS